MNSIDLKIIQEWVVSEGISTILYGIKRHHLLFPQIINNCYFIIGKQLFNYLNPTEKSILWADDKEKVVFFKNFCISFETIEEFESSPICEKWYKFMVKFLKRSK